MNRSKILLISLGFVLLSSVVFFIKIIPALAAAGDASWAKVATTAPSASYFLGSTTDTSGNIYAVGYITGNGEYNFGNGITVNGAVAGFQNALIIKYNPEGVAQWASSTTVAPNTSSFNNVGLDLAGNVYVTGYIANNGEYNFGNGVTATGNCGTSSNALLIKYNSDGLAQWARTTVTAPKGSSFLGSWVDPSNNIYAAGYIYGNGQYNFGNSVTVTGNKALENNALIIKYNSDGLAQWAYSTTTAPAKSIFETIKGDLSGNIYVAGYIIGTGSFNFGNSVTISGGNASFNGAIFKYNSSGQAQWAKTATTAPGASDFNSMVVDTVGNSFLAGYLTGTGSYDFGSGVTVSGNSTGQNAMVIKYDSSGNAQWAKSTVTAPAGEGSEFNDVVYSSACGLFAVGWATGNGEYNFGSGATTTGASEFTNPIIVEYNSEGSPLWAKSTSVAPEMTNSYFQDATADASENIYVAGGIETTDQYSFGGVTVNGGSAGQNSILVKYAGDTTTTCPAGTSSHPEFINLPGDSRPVNLDEGGVITDSLYTLEVRPGGKGIVQVEFYVDENLICTDTSADSSGVYSCVWDTTKYHSSVKIIAYYLNGRKITLTRNVEVKASTDEIAVLPKTGAD